MQVHREGGKKLQSLHGHCFEPFCYHLSSGSWSLVHTLCLISGTFQLWKENQLVQNKKEPESCREF